MELITINLIIVFINLAILGFNLKLYTEYFKDRRIEGRHATK